MMGVLGVSASAKDWEKLEKCRLIMSEYRDGDSFHVKHGMDEFIFRLYYVDAPETDSELKDRIDEQAQYFDVSPIRIHKLGKTAEQLAAKKMQSDFTVYTKWEDAGGQSRLPRYFGVVLIGKEDLAETLVSSGLARVYGASSDMPDGRNVNTMFDQLRKLEARAKQKRLGAWEKRKGDAKDTAAAPASEEEPVTDAAETTGLVVEEEADYAVIVLKWPNVPTVAFLRAEAFVNLERFEEAEAELQLLLKKYPEHDQKPRIEFYIALSIAMQERFPEAVERFQTWLADHPHDILKSETEYWMPIAMFYDSRYEEALPRLEKYAVDYPMAAYAPEAKYRAALCRYAVEDYKACALDLGAWLEKYPEHFFRWEALVTRGDSLAAMGELELAKTNYLRVTKDAGAFHYLALTQLAKVYKALGTEQDFRDMAAVFARFIQENPESDHVVDAAYQAGWALRQANRTEEARRLYWNVVERFGNNNRWEGFQPILEDLGKLYGDQPDLYLQDLRAKYAAALQERRLTLASRLALAEIEAAPAATQKAAALEFAKRYKGDYLGAEALAFLGDLFVRDADADRGLPYLQTLLQQFPQSSFAPLAHTRLAEQAAAKRNYTNALAYADVAIENMGDPQLMMEAVFVRAKSLEGLQRYAEAVEAYQQVIANRISPRALKPEAMLGVAASLEAQGKVKEAIPYYQRIYVMYQAYAPAVAKAYLKSGEAFEKLNDRPSAVNTYKEMLETKSLSGLPEMAMARERLARLGS
ncbi:MAG: hypothetical protein A2X46_09060 [Lentisphaerae bacterium GWF2_57_35]|nr:MAG: hypothetical protein A2X46_09060 [Lentisphaerae bacterium GWF2_57_35]